ncbi:MAG: hypothetical protein JRI55_14655 [Deltaproteobacteria bacterium]|nr:hypothetical protein [Deltaproteobacteria bacterium]
MTRTIFLLAVMLASSRAPANDGRFGGNGAVVFPLKERRVRMVNEKVTIRFDQKAEEKRRYDRVWAAECVFLFENKTAEQIVVQMGFPNWCGDLNPDLPRCPVSAIKDFRTWVNGEETKATLKKAALGMTGKAVDKRLLVEGGAFVWEVTFPPRGRVVVRNSYRFGTTTTPGAEGGPRHIHWRNHPVDKGLPYNQVNYIVTTGRTWAGTIGEADIKIEIPPDAKPHFVAATPRPREIGRKWVRWHFKSWRPKKNLNVSYFDAYPDKPPFRSLRDLRRWLRFSRNNGMLPEVLETILKMYSCRYTPESVADRAQCNSLDVNRPDEAVEMPTVQRTIVKLLQRELRRLKSRAARRGRLP